MYKVKMTNADVSMRRVNATPIKKTGVQAKLSNKELKKMQDILGLKTNIDNNTLTETFLKYAISIL